MKRLEILKTKINITNMKRTLEFIQNDLNCIKGNYICVSNVHTTVMSYENENYRKVQNESYMSLPDGRPLSIIQKIKGYTEAERVTGPDLMEEIFKISEEKGYTHYFYGSTEDTLKKLNNRLNKKYPKLKIVGMYSPPFRILTEDEDKKIINEINTKSPDFLWVGLGAPKQELWMYEHKNKVNSLMIGVGAGFDYLAGNIKRAPKWMQIVGFEWLYRLIQDPKRLFKRYLVTNLKFLIFLIKMSIGEILRIK